MSTDRILTMLYFIFTKCKCGEIMLIQNTEKETHNSWKNVL